MGAAPQDAVYGTFRFLEPDLSVPASERAYFSAPASKRIIDEKMQLHNIRTSPHLAQGFRGLDLQGFTYVQHSSSLTGEELLTGTNAEDIYVPEIIDLMLKLTGGARAVVHNVTFRRRLATDQQDLNFVRKAGGEWDRRIKAQPIDKIGVHGRNGDDREPARHAHCDMVIDSLSDTLRMCRKDISDAGRAAIIAEEERDNGKDVRVPRYAVYSLWRPLKAVKRDPIAVLDYRSLNPKELIQTDFRMPSNLVPEGEYISKAWLHGPPGEPSALKWYYLPEQKVDEVMVIKFCDSASREEGSDVAANCIHCSPDVLGMEHEEARESVEARVYVFWN